MSERPRSRARMPSRRATRGVALTALLVLMIVVGAGLLLGALGSSPRARIDSEARQARVLALARQAVLAYAVEISNPASPNRPGSLLCPDVDHDGDSEPGSDMLGSNCAAELGWLPYATLELPELRDASGNRLWYAISQNYRSNAALVRNSETPGAITVDGAGDVVAVIIAPGEALDGQTRPGSGFDATDPAQRAAFLEGDNASADLQTFTRGAAAPFNDRLVTITRAELMRAVEQRVIGEVAVALRSYSASWGGSWATGTAAFPWMKPFEDPRTAVDFHGVAGQGEGLLPMHDPGGGDEVFPSPWALDWSGLTQAPDFAFGTVTPADLQSGPVGGLAMAAAGSTCGWFAAAPGQSRCSGSAQTSLGLLTYLGFPVITSVRTYTFTNVGLTSATPGVPSAVAAPTAGEVRTRTVSVTPGAGVLEPGGRIDIRDDLVIDVFGASIALVSGLGRITVTPGTTGTVSVAGVRYWLDPARELPAWFTANQWHHVIHAAASPAYLAGGSLDCTASGNCLSLVAFGGAAASNQVGLAVLGAGGALAGQDRTSPPALASDYFEQENAVAGDATVARRGYTPVTGGAFNDGVRVMLRGELL